MNRTLKLLVFSDIFVLTGFGLISPIMAVFIKDNLIGGTIVAIGIAAAITTLVRCILQLIFAYIAKPNHRYVMTIAGTFVIMTVPFIYLFSTNVTHIYLAALVNGIGAGLANPAWFSLFAANLNKKARGWGVVYILELCRYRHCCGGICRLATRNKIRIYTSFHCSRHFIFNRLFHSSWLE